MPKQYIYPKQARLLTRKDLEGVIQQQDRIEGKYFFLFYRANTLESSRLGIIVSKRAAPAAVDRNRVRRTIREFFRLRRTNLNCFDLVFITRSTAKKASGGELIRCLEKLYKKLIQSCELV